jgi:uncharacterized membrane protein
MTVVQNEGCEDKTEGEVGPWFKNSRTALLLLVVLASALTLPYFRKFQDWFPKTHPAFLAMFAGVIITSITYPPMRYADPKYAFSHAVLLGLLVAEFVVYGAPFDFPAPVAVSFFFFMFTYGAAEADHLFPDTYKGSL